MPAQALREAEREVLAACREWRGKPGDWTVYRKKIASATDRYIKAKAKLKEDKGE